MISYGVRILGGKLGKSDWLGEKVGETDALILAVVRRRTGAGGEHMVFPA